MQDSTPSDINVLRPKRGEEAEDKAAAGLQTQVETLRTERKHERYFWILGTIALLNVIIDCMSGWYGRLTFLLFSLLFLIAAAKWLEVPFIVHHLEKWFARASITSSKNETE